MNEHLAIAFLVLTVYFISVIIYGSIFLRKKFLVISQNTGLSSDKRQEFITSWEKTWYGFTGLLRYDMFYTAIRYKRFFFILLPLEFCLFEIGASGYLFNSYRLVAVSLVILILHSLLNVYFLKPYSPHETTIKLKKVGNSFSFLFSKFFFITFGGLFLVEFILGIKNNYPNLKNSLDFLEIQTSLLSGIQKDLALVYASLTIGFLIVFYAKFMTSLSEKRNNIIINIWDRMMSELGDMDYLAPKKFKIALYYLIFDFNPFKRSKGEKEEDIYLSKSDLTFLKYSPLVFFIFSLYFLIYPNLISSSEERYLTWDLIVFLFIIAITWKAFMSLIRVFNQYLANISE